ncbi:MAG: HAMP domain-containing sensor histidine kinase [Eubacteriales bacterium]|nr:HAMP domain-containing sensor histidine kinase [Eubacteriales bacterium]
MDGKSRQEVKKYILSFFVWVLCITTGVYMFARYEERMQRNQIAELAELHPELEADIIRIMEKSDWDASRETDQLSEEEKQILTRLEETYGYHYTRSITNHRVWRFGIFSVAITGMMVMILWILSGRKKETQEKESEEQRMKLEEALKEANTHLADLKERYGREEEKTKALITDISHQLKTPLASLRMSHELAASDYLTEEERKEFAEQVETEIERLQILLDEMIKLSRLEKNMIELKPERSRIKDTLSEAVSVIYPKALAKSMNILVEMKEELIVKHDVHWTVEVFTNILDNAVKYSPENTEIKICIKPLARYAMIEFMDEGTGIPDEEKHRIYQRFYRGKNSEGIEGTGVGLFLARQILEAEDGNIMVKNRHPKGNVFRVMLPL